MATIYQCLYRNLAHTVACRSENQGKRSKCKGCRSDIVARHGHAIIAHHRGDGNYSLSDALQTFQTMSGAERAADRLYTADNSSDVVARFVLA